MNNHPVFIIRFAERRIDQLLDACLLDHTPLASEFDSVEFESDWSIFRPFSSGKRKSTTTAGTTPSATSASTIRGAHASSPPTSPGFARPPSPSGSLGHNLSTSVSGGAGAFSSLRQSFAKSRNPSQTPIQSMFEPGPTPADITSFLTALHTLLTLSDINPATTTQLWSQIMYWTSCELLPYQILVRSC